jgi:hypothetical protein
MTEIDREKLAEVIYLAGFERPNLPNVVPFEKASAREWDLRAADAVIHYLDEHRPKGRVVELNIELSKESLDCLIEMAGYGISYWAVAAEYDDEARTYTVTENEEGENEKHVIPYDKIIDAFWQAANPGSKIKGWHEKHETREYALRAVIDGILAGKGDIDAGHIDSDLADNIIQLAAFGEVQFG